ncbi:hypothetical protein KAR04_09655 [Candidatus Calescamantes bacterium]|nr:hypothetical protein [Candidatus Calescamantes bacterium]
MKNLKRISLNNDLQLLISAYGEFLCEYGIFHRTMLEFPNTFGYDEIKKNIDKNLSELRRYSPDSNLEKLLLHQMEFAYGVFECFSDYYFMFPEKPIDELLKKIFGNSILDDAEEMIRHLDYRKIWDYYKLEDRYSHQRITLYNNELDEKIRKVFDHIKRSAVQWGVERDIIPEGLQIEIELSSFGNGSNYDPETKRIEIDRNYFLVFSDGAEKKINPLLVIPTVFHEFFGHALNGVYSEQLPLPFQADWNADPQIFNKSVSEGIAGIAAEWSLELIEERKDEFNINDQDITYLKELLKINPIMSMISGYFGYLRFKGAEDPDFNPTEKLIEISNNRGFAYNMSQQRIPDMQKLIYQISSYRGKSLVRSVYNDLIAQGKDVATADKAILSANSGLHIYKELVGSITS